jgi:hypothetical protein
MLSAALNFTLMLFAALFCFVPLSAALFPCLFPSRKMAKSRKSAEAEVWNVMDVSPVLDMLVLLCS